MKRSDAIKQMLINSTHADLAALYDSCMEVQVNVAQGNGERVDKEFKGKNYQAYSDSIDTWSHFRIPHNAKTSPENNDYEMSYNLAEHAEGIGLSGWDWQNQQSRWVAFDFDAISGHSESHAKKLNNVELQAIQESVSTIPWVTTRVSTGGKGLHLYVFLDNVPTENHVEHAAVARSILGLLSALTGTDLKASVDAVGQNFWIWHRKMIGTDGLRLIKQGTILENIPPSWRDHINVINNRGKRTVPSFVSDSGVQSVEKLFEELTNSKTHIPLDAEHQRLIKFLHENNCCSWWDSDNQMLVTHTIHLQDAYNQLGLKGIFKTIATGTEKGADHNVFLFAMRNGSWVVRRYTPGVAEDSSWGQDASGYTRCYLNREPELQDAARARGGIENTAGGFVFREAECAAAVAKDIGVDVKLPKWILTGRETIIKKHKDNRLLVKIKHDPSDVATELGGWLPEKSWWTRIYNVPVREKVESETGNYDDMIRHLLTENREDAGWTIKTESEWGAEPLIHVRVWLKSLDLKQAESDGILGSCIGKPWRLICEPFKPELPGGRLWNRNAPQLAFIPSQSDTLSFPTWSKILNHLGKGLNDAVAGNPWCKHNGVLSGADYLFLWIASLFQEPSEPLPYIFCFSKEQNTGKTSLYEAITLLVTRGVERADTALISTNGFNGELENTILCVIDEVSMAKNVQAYNRIKDYTTAKRIQIHRKNMTPYSVINTTHWLQLSNSKEACPVFEGDSRIVMVEVGTINPEDEIPKKELLPLLTKESPDFLAAILKLEIPKSGSRLNVPVIETAAKRSAVQSSKTYLELFLEEFVFYVSGETINYGEMYNRFTEWLEPSQLSQWTKIRFGKEMPQQYPKGRSRATNQILIGNCSWTEKQSELPVLILTTSGHLESRAM